MFFWSRFYHNPWKLAYGLTISVTRGLFLMELLISQIKSRSSLEYNFSCREYFHLEHGSLRSSSGGYFFHAVIQLIYGNLCIWEACWGPSKFFLECSKMIIRFPCQKVTIVEEFTHLPLTIHNFQETCAPIYSLKTSKIAIWAGFQISIL